MELQDRIDEAEGTIRALRGEIEALRDEIAAAREHRDRDRRAFELELQGRAIELEALRSKVRGLELLTRNAATNEDLDAQIAAVLRQARKAEPITPAPQTPKKSWTIRAIRSGGPDPDDH
jgi:predicted RNase H-like nuclease (RuvC/YqgF family)